MTVAALPEPSPPQVGVDPERTEPWAVILGCSVGTGAGIARALARHQRMNIVGVHRGNHPADADAVARDVEAAGARAVMLVGDGGRLEHIPGIAQRMQEAIGPRGGVRVLVHAVAGASIGYVVHEDERQQVHPKQIVSTFELMAHSFLWWGQHLFQQRLFAPGAQILAMQNYLDECTAWASVAIGASKAALNGYVSYMGAEMAPYGVRVNGVRFGATDTYSLQQLPAARAAMDFLPNVAPMGRVCTVDDVGDLVSLLVDDRAAYMNGSMIDFDGGERRAFVRHMFGLAKRPS